MNAHQIPQEKEASTDLKYVKRDTFLNNYGKSKLHYSQSQNSSSDFENFSPEMNALSRATLGCNEPELELGLATL